VDGKKLTLYRTNTNTCRLVENMKAKRITILKELGKLTL
jgi:hypothetical protein